MEQQQGGGVERGGAMGWSWGEALSCWDSKVNRGAGRGREGTYRDDTQERRRGVGTRVGATSCPLASVAYRGTLQIAQCPPLLGPLYKIPHIYYWVICREPSYTSYWYPS
jgi:hypothetical protein